MKITTFLIILFVNFNLFSQDKIHTSDGRPMNSISNRPTGISKQIIIEQDLAQESKQIKLIFDRIITMKLDPITDTLIESWETFNHCEYIIDQNRTKLSFSEKDSIGIVVKTWALNVHSYQEDEHTYSFVCEKDDGNITIVVWKSLTMIAIEGSDATYLVSGYQTNESGD